MQATNPFLAETEKELSLAVGDYIVVRKVNPDFPCYLVTVAIAFGSILITEIIHMHLEVLNPDFPCYLVTVAFATA